VQTLTTKYGDCIVSQVIDALELILESNPKSGSFFASNTASTKDLELQVKDFGSLKFPLSARKAKALINCATPAKFGWRDQTVHDKNVRDVWEINKNKVKIDKRLWNKTLSPVLDKLKCDLGLPENALLKADLHNLLIYAPGQFFSPHRDSEKLDGMLATLLVVLPSEHSGGSLVVEHQGTKKQFHSSRYALDKLAFIAFYADCYHEVKPIKSGYRVVLSYNLVLDNKADLPNISMDTGTLTSALKDYFSDQSDVAQPSYQKKTPKKLVYLLDHSYTQKGLSWQQLKSVDRPRVAALRDAADSLGLDIHLALADMQEAWQCEIDYYHYRDRRRYYYENDDIESNAEPIELIEHVVTIRHWLDVNANPLDYKDLSIPDSQLHWTTENDEFEPFETEYEGWMGNYGCTLDRWYHRAAIILWRQQDHFSILLEMNPEKVVTHMLTLGGKKANLSELHSIAKTIVPYWSDCLPGEPTPAFQKKILKLALCLEHAAYAKKILQEFKLNILQVKTIPLLISLADCYGITWCISLFKTWAIKEGAYRFNVQLCENIHGLLKALTVAGGTYDELCNWLIKYQFTTIKKSSEYIKDRIQQVIDLLYGCSAVSDDQTYVNLINEVIKKNKLYPALKLMAIVDSFANAEMCNTPLQKKAQKSLCDYINDILQAEYELGLRKPTDWSIQTNTGCNCQDCATFTKYLRSHTKIDMVWPMGKERRAHIHRKIDSLNLPISHTTLRQGSPHKLVLKKTKELYARAKKRYTAIDKALDKLQPSVLVVPITD